jgi:SAM-dependent methyltransferase
MTADEIETYYQAMGERTRIVEGRGRLEYLRTWDILTRSLPAAPAAVLDVGGATGVYARPLAEAGYTVHVVDLMPDHVADAAALPGVTASVGDARALDIHDDQYDATLLLGPLYHLQERDDRVRAWSEARRVTRTGGLVAGAIISRYASFLDGSSGGFAADPAFRDVTRQDLRNGRHENPDRVEGWFTTAYFQHPAEVASEVADAGLRLDRLVPVEMALGFARGATADMLESPEIVEWMLGVMRDIEDDPTILAASPHVLALARS